MAQNISLMGAEYTDVPAVVLPKTGGGTAQFDDTTDANATAEDVLTGKTAYVNGKKIIGTGNVGGNQMAEDYTNVVVKGGTLTDFEWTVPSTATVYLSSISNRVTNVTIHGGKTFNSTTPVTTGIISCPDVTTGVGNMWTGANFPTKVVYLPKCTVGSNFAVGANQKPLIKLVIKGNPWIAGNSLRNSPHLKAVVITATSVPTLTQINALNNSGIGANSDGYIYVPSSLYDSYIVATNWSTVADKIRKIEDYPLINAPDTWLPTEGES